MKRYIIILVLLMAFYPFIGGQKGCMSGSGTIGVPGEEGGDQLMVDTAALGGEQGTKDPDADLGKELVCPDDAVLGEDPVCDAEVFEDGTVNCYAADDIDKVNPVLCQYVAKTEEECPTPPVKRVPACVGLMPEAKAGFIYDYARLDEAIVGMEGVGENFRENLTKAVDPMGLVEDVQNVDSVCIACDYRSKTAVAEIKYQAGLAGHPFSTWPAMLKVYGLCEEVLVIYSFKEGKENLMAEKFADVPSAEGIYTFPDSTIRAAQSGNNALFGTSNFLTVGLSNANSPSETFLSKNIEFYLPAGILFYTNKDIVPLVHGKVMLQLLKMYTIVMPAQSLALGQQSDSILTSIDVLEKEMKLSAGIYAENKDAIVLGSSSFGIEQFGPLSSSSWTLFQKVKTMIDAESAVPEESEY